MKIQDLIFLVLVIILIVRNRAIISAWIGIICMVIAIPFFAKWVFFTAERLTWYGAGCLLISLIQQIVRTRLNKTS